MYRSHRSLRIGPAGIALALLAMSAPVSAAGPPAPAELMTRTAEGLAPVRQRVADVRRHLQVGGRVLSAIEAAASAAEVELPSSEPGGTAPLTLREAVDLIVDEVRAVDAQARRGGRELRARGLGDHRALMASALESDLSSEETAPNIDPAPALAGAARIAGAIDRAIPALRAAAPGSGSGRDGAGCDLVDQLPHVCVGGEGANLYNSDAMVLIDLGGDDQHAHAAASATAGAALVLDLGGNDHYEPTASTSPQAVAALAGVAMLVDDAGNDVYRATSSGEALSGQALGGLGGAAFLVDRAGNDRYEVIGDSEIRAAVSGQGLGTLGGVGALLDGSGNDRYHLSSTGRPRVPSGSSGNTVVDRVSAGGQGYAALGGVGLLADGGGDDDFTVEARVTPVPGDARDARRARVDFLAEASVIGQGTSVVGGSGFLLSGVGDTSYLMEATMGPVPSREEPVGASVSGQGAGAVGATGVLSDAGGNDAYTARGSATSRIARTVTDGCSCAGFVDAYVGTVDVYAQAYAVNGIALLQDDRGDDRYVVEAQDRAEVEIIDERTEAAVPMGAESRSGLSRLYGQGIATADSVGALVDSAGNDLYSLRSDSVAAADGSTEVPTNDPILYGRPGRALLVGQGAGVGRVAYNGSSSVYGPGAIASLIDFGGRDRYVSAVSARGIVNGEPEDQGQISHQVQGSAELPADLPVDLPATGFLADIGATGGDEFVQSPPVEACTGERGTAVWVDCNPVALGVNGNLSALLRPSPSATSVIATGPSGPWRTISTGASAMAEPDSEASGCTQRGARAPCAGRRASGLDDEARWPRGVGRGAPPPPCEGSLRCG